MADEPKSQEPGPGDQRPNEIGEFELVYELEGRRNNLPIFELARVLDAFGTVIQEANHVLHPKADDIVMRVRPFEEGSFVMDVLFAVQQNPAVLFVLSQPEALEQIKKVLEYLGLIKKAKDVWSTLLDLIRFLKNGRPDKVEPAGNNTYNYYDGEGQVMTVPSQVHNLVNNGTIQQFFFSAFGSPLQQDGIDALRTFVKSEPQETAVRIPKADIPALQAYGAPLEPEPKEEVIENTTTELLNPKSGMYGETDAPYTFTRVGMKRNMFKATLTDRKFLSKYERGLIRFYHDDVLKVRLRQIQKMKGRKGTVTYEIVEVLDYSKAPAPRSRR